MGESQQANNECPDCRGNGFIQPFRHIVCARCCGDGTLLESDSGDTHGRRCRARVGRVTIHTEAKCNAVGFALLQPACSCAVLAGVVHTATFLAPGAHRAPITLADKLATYCPYWHAGWYCYSHAQQITDRMERAHIPYTLTYAKIS